MESSDQASLEQTEKPLYRRYMSKSQRPCDFCRSRKNACRIDAGLPCRLCKSYGRECTFHSSRIRKAIVRGNKPVSTVEGGLDGQKRANELQEIVATCEQRPTTRAIASPDTPPVESRGSSLNLVQNQLPEEFLIYHEPQTVPAEAQPGESNMTAARNSHHISPISFNDIQSSPSISQRPPLASFEGVVHQLCGLTGDMDPYLMSQYRFDERDTFTFKRLAIRAASKDIVPVQFLLSPASTSQASLGVEELASTEPITRRQELEDLVPADVGQRYISLFFDHVYCLFPILDLASPPSPKHSPVFLLAAIYLVARNFAIFDDYLCIQVVYDAPPPENLANIVWRCITALVNEPTLALVQCAILLLVAPPQNILMPENNFKYNLLGSTVSMAYTLGLNLDPRQWSIPKQEIRLRRRLSWSIFAIDRWLSAATGRPRLISTTDWLVAPLDAEDFTETEAKPGQPDLFLQFLKLTLILDTILDTLFSLRSVQVLSSDFRQTLRASQPLMEALSDWQKDLPASIIGHQPREAHQIDSSGPLFLAYHMAKIYVFRAILRPFHNMSSGLVSPESDATSVLEASGHVRLAARSCATAFSDFVANLGNRQFNAFWPIWSQAGFSTLCNFWMLLFVTSKTTEEATECKRALEEARKTVRLQARAFDTLRFALLRVDSIYWSGFTRTLHLNEAVQKCLEECGTPD